MNAPARTSLPRRAVFEDGLGKRYSASSPGGEPLEVLALRDEWTAVSSFEFALRERVSALAAFQHTSFARIRSVQVVGQEMPTLAVVTDAVVGARLSNILAVTEAELLPIEINVAMYLVRQLVHALAALHEQMPGVSHGAIAPERLVVAPDGRLVILDHGLGAALEQLRLSPEQYWKELSIPLPQTTGVPRFDQRADVMQVGAVALALIVGRPLHNEDYPHNIGAVAERAWAVTSTGSVEPLPFSLRAWLTRALQLDARQSFASGVEAWAEFDRILHDVDCVAPVGQVKSFLADYRKHLAADRSAAEMIRPAIAAPGAPPSIAVASAAISEAAPTAPVPIAPASTMNVAAPPERAVAPAPALAPPPRPARYHASPVPDVPAAAIAPSTGHSLGEEDAEPDMTHSAPWWRRRWVAAAAVLVVLASGAALAGRSRLVPAAAAEASGTLVVNTNPAGAVVMIDGQPQGVTPLTVALRPGGHTLELLSDGEPRTIPLTITAGGMVSQFIDLPKAGPLTGQLQVRTEPSGARVTLDGMDRGVAPLTIDGVTPGVHTVLLVNALGSVSHQVAVEAGATASLVVPMTTPNGAPVSGWISVSAPADVMVYEDTRLLGSSRSDRIMVSVGRHELDIVNEGLGYRARRTVNVSPGQVAAVKLEWPQGTMSLNAQPWANVWINGERIGDTPIGNVSVPIGTHEVVFRHPELGEQVVRATVTLNEPARLSVDLRKR